MVVKRTCTSSHPMLIKLYHILITRRKEENMILAETTNIVLLEEIGGKDHFITRNMASALQDMNSRLFSRGVPEVLGSGCYRFVVDYSYGHLMTNSKSFYSGFS